MKKTIDKKKNSKIFIKIAISVLVCALAMVVPTAIISIKAPIEEKFSPKSDYQGVVEVWNIDTFEGGSASKTSFLSATALSFQNSNKGTYLLIKNMTPSECALALEQGQHPQLFSFGSAFANALKNELAEVSANESVCVQIANSATIDQKTYAIGYAKSAYVLISLQENLADSQSSISSQAFVCGNKKQLRNGKEKITYSLVFGGASTSPSVAFENKFYLLVAGETTFDKTDFSKTSYQAYCDFVEGKSKILLGTIRDVFRVKNRENQGKLSNVVYEPVGECADLVQYFGIDKTATEKQKLVCEKFINFVLSEPIQQKLNEVGLLSARDGLKLYDTGVMSDIERSVVGAQISSIF